MDLVHNEIISTQILVILVNEIHSESDIFRVSVVEEINEEESKNGHKKEEVIIEEKIEMSSCHTKDHNLQSHMLHGRDQDQIDIDERCGKASEYILMLEEYEIGMFSRYRKTFFPNINLW